MCLRHICIQFSQAAWKPLHQRFKTYFQLWVAPAFLCGTITPHSDICKVWAALPTPSPQQYVRLCSTLFSAVLEKSIQGVCMGIGSGVSNQIRVSCVGAGRGRTPTQCSAVSRVTRPTPPRPSDGLLVNPLCRQQKIWPRTQSPNHVIHHPRVKGHRGSPPGAPAGVRD